MVPAVALKLAVVAPDVTVTVGGTVSAPALLFSDTTAPPAPAALDRVTVQAEVPPDDRFVGAQLNPLTTVGATKEMLACCEVLL